MYNVVGRSMTIEARYAASARGSCKRCIRRCIWENSHWQLGQIRLQLCAASFSGSLVRIASSTWLFRLHNAMVESWQSYSHYTTQSPTIKHVWSSYDACVNDYGETVHTTGKLGDESDRAPVNSVGYATSILPALEIQHKIRLITCANFHWMKHIKVAQNSHVQAREARGLKFTSPKACGIC
jgi:hypothetical protein